MDNIKLLVLDIDGVLTDGTKVYGVDGEVIGKRYKDLDFTAIKQLKKKWVFRYVLFLVISGSIKRWLLLAVLISGILECPMDQLIRQGLCPY